MNNKIITLALLLASACASADYVGTSHKKVTGYNITAQGDVAVFLFSTEGTPAGGCNTSGRFAVDANSPLFQGTQSAIMAAYHSQSDVTVYHPTPTADTCNMHSNSLDIHWVCVGDVPC